jgi:hypothetical protein
MNNDYVAKAAHKFGICLIEGGAQYLNPVMGKDLRFQQYFNTLIGSCGEHVMSHSLAR